MEFVRQLEGLDPLAGGAVELIDIGAIFVGDENALAVIRDADSLRIEARVIRIPEFFVGPESKLSERPVK